jgi:AcrR family transcriptional regulator
VNRRDDNSRSAATRGVAADAYDATSAKRGRPRNPCADAAIRRATLELLGERGYDRASIESIAQRAAVSKTTIYRRFSSKSQLVAWSVSGSLGVIHDVDTGDFRQDLIELSRATIDMMDDPTIGPAVVGVLSAMPHSPELTADMKSSFRRGEAEMYAQVCSRAVARGQLKADAPVELALGAISNTVYASYLLLGEKLTVDDTVRLIDLVLPGLGYRSRDRLGRASLSR